MSSRQGSVTSRRARRATPWALVLLLGSLMAGILPSAFAAPGDSAAEAVPLGPDGAFHGVTGPQKSTWFHFRYMGGGTTATITAEYEPEDSTRTDLVLHTGPAQNLRRESTTATRSGNILTQTFVDPEPRDVYVELVNDHPDRSVGFVGSVSPSSAAATPAAGTVTPTPGPADGSAQTALAVSSGGTLTGTVGGRRAVWYRFWYGNPGADASASVTFAPNADNTDLKLWTGADPNNLTEQSGAPTRSGDTLSRRVNLSSPQYVYFNLANNNDATIVAYSGQVTPAFATPTPIVTATATAAASPTATPPGPTATAQPAATPQPAPSVPHDERYFTETRFRIDNDAVWNYFTLRGGVNTFGLPISRTFRFLGFTTQLFQRKAVQVGPDGNARLMNVLDPGLMGFTTSINFSPIPPFDDGLVASAPAPGSPGYDTAIVDFIRQNAPETLNGRPVSFFSTFQSTVTCPIAFPNQPCQENLLPLMNLEMWGSVTSRPLVDPNNANFIFLRFQRGVMHFQGVDAAGRPIIGGTLLGLQFASLLAGGGLPADLEQQARTANSSFLRQYCAGAPGWLCRPGELSSTDLTFAFEQG